MGLEFDPEPLVLILLCALTGSLGGKVPEACTCWEAIAVARLGSDKVPCDLGQDVGS